MLKTAGFKTVHSLAGGIKAWQGLTAAGAPEAGMSFFPADARSDKLIGLAWTLEEGSRKFYLSLASMPGIGDAADLFAELVAAEEHHKTSLKDLYRELSGKDDVPVFPGNQEAGEDRMEGGMKISEALSWVKGKNVQDVLELAMALETHSYDLYIKMGRKVPEANARKVFDRLVLEEKEHLERMAQLMDRSLG